MNEFWWMPNKTQAQKEKYSAGYTDASQKGYYDSPFWRQLRATKLQLKPFCEICEGNYIITPANTVDHKKALPQQCSWQQFIKSSNIINLQSL